MPRRAGFKQSEETKQKLREAQQKLWSDPEYRAKQIEKITKSGFGAGRDPEASRKTLQNNWDNPEWREMMRQKQSEGAKRRWADKKKRQELLDARKPKDKDEE